MKISIITTTYNSAKTVQDTFQSILQQSYSNIELIVVDGGSKDDTLKLIKAYEVLFEGRMHYISEPDKGIYDAMNKGIRMATGDIIGILNSDDFYTSEDVLQKMVEVFEENPTVDAVYGDVHFVNASDLNKSIRYYSSKIFRRSLMRFGFMPAHPTFYMRKSSIDKYGLYKMDYKICADFEYLLRVIFVNQITIKYIPKDMVTMRVGGASTSGLSSHIQIMKEHLRAFRENGVYTNPLLLSLRYFYKLTEYLR